MCTFRHNKSKAGISEFGPARVHDIEDILNFCNYSPGKILVYILLLFCFFVLVALLMVALPDQTDSFFRIVSEISLSFNFTEWESYDWFEWEYCKYDDAGDGWCI